MRRATSSTGESSTIAKPTCLPRPRVGQSASARTQTVPPLASIARAMERMAPMARASATSDGQHGNGIGVRLPDHHPGGTTQTETGARGGVVDLHGAQATWTPTYLVTEATTTGVAAETSGQEMTDGRPDLREMTDGKSGIGTHTAVVGHRTTRGLASVTVKGNELKCTGDRHPGHSLRAPLLLLLLLPTG